ncbi:1-aminocyclopropane-1-carboxylate deaminase/D-cysteine desulfhydrase [Candidatus Latescibacterota bacterium]
MISLFEKFPLLKEKLPYVSLGDFPTPVKKLDRLENHIGVDQLYIKGDDVSGKIYGGNKVRKLEFLLGSALENGVKEVLTYGCAGSNHALATAVYANKCGMRSISMLLPQSNAYYIRRNLLMSYHNNAELHHYRSRPSLSSGTRYQLRRHTSKHGVAPQVIPSGGTTPLGTVGYVNAGFELSRQIDDGTIPEPTCIYITFGTMGAAAGLLLGLRAAGLKTRLIAARVVPGFVANPEKFESLFKETNELLHLADPSFPIISLTDQDVTLRSEFYGGQYALYTQEGVAAVQLMKETEDIKLDGCYTGKTLACLVHDAKRGDLKNNVVLFWNTLNSRDFSGHIESVDYHKLPRAFHRYFEEDVQPLDKALT